MARPLRIEYPNAYYHVSNKGEDRKSIFPGGEYCESFIEGLEQACKRLNVQVHAYCLLDNEYHLLLKTPEGNLSRFMRQVDGLYTQAYQNHKGRGGGVFRGRYKSVLVQAEAYWLGLSRYLHNLPDMECETYPWSSLPEYLNRGKGPQWLHKTEIYGLLASADKASTPSGYRQYFADGVDEEIEQIYSKKNMQSVLGNDKFKKMAQGKLSSTAARGVSRGAEARKRPSLSKVVATVANEFKVSEKSIYKAARGPGSKNLPRWTAMYLCQELAGVTLQKIAERFGLQRYGTVSTTIGKLKQEFTEEPKLVSRVERLSSRLI